MAVKRKALPKTHAQGKPVRGVRGPGVRGPNKKPAELLAERNPGTRPIQISYQTRVQAELVPAPDSTLKERKGSRAGRELQRLIQLVGDEEIDPHSVTNHWTRIEAVVRRLYTEAMLGKTSASQLLFERGWGRVPMPVRVDFTTEMARVLDESGLTEDDIQQDPLLRQLIMGPAQGHIIENEGDDAKE